LETKQYPLFDNVAAVERTTFEYFVVAGPLIGEKDRKEGVCDVPRRSDKGAKDELKKCGTKLRWESKKQPIDPRG
jgi:hypothetical protein